MIISVGPQAISEAPHLFLVFHKSSGCLVLLKTSLVLAPKYSYIGLI